MGNACKPLLVFGWEQVGGMACQAIKMACKPKSRAWAGDPTQIHAPARHKPFRAGASHSAKPKMSLSGQLEAAFIVAHLAVPELRNTSVACRIRTGGRSHVARVPTFVSDRNQPWATGQLEAAFIVANLAIPELGNTIGRGDREQFIVGATVRSCVAGVTASQGCCPIDNRTEEIPVEAHVLYFLLVKYREPKMIYLPETGRTGRHHNPHGFATRLERLSRGGIAGIPTSEIYIVIDDWAKETVVETGRTLFSSDDAGNNRVRPFNAVQVVSIQCSGDLSCHIAHARPSADDLARLGADSDARHFKLPSAHNLHHHSRRRTMACAFFLSYAPDSGSSAHFKVERTSNSTMETRSTTPQNE
ncbi:hypothetical protein C8R44DRAFT_733223 [Mycena epipterygia]|nr:hypothetical protein C8R44DRAFT_733223 [Mycena epipterygia]